MFNSCVDTFSIVRSRCSAPAKWSLECSLLFYCLASKNMDLPHRQAGKGEICRIFVRPKTSLMSFQCHFPLA